MVINGVAMYKAIVVVFGTHIRRAMMKYGLVGWTLPALFPIAGIFWGGTNFADPKT